MTHHDNETEQDYESYHPGTASRLNWLRAGVLGANDGIISIAGLVIGVAAASGSADAIATAGIAGLVAGAVSMALGEYVSVSTQRDSERATVEVERRELAEMPDEELGELRRMLEQLGLSTDSARRAADELTESDALGTHLRFELGIDPNELTNPWSAALSSAIAFTIGAMLPLLAILIPPAGARIPVTFGAVIIALAIAGSLSARLGGAPRWPAIRRLVVGGVLAMVVTMGIGSAFGTVVG